MADIFTSKDIQELLKDKLIWFLGDSNVRATYKDFVWLIQKNSFISLDNLRAKLEPTFLSDRLLRGKTLDRGRNYQEVRRYENFKLGTTIEFNFLTRCLTEDLEDKLRLMREAPDLIIINSCLWDIVRWGPDGVINYKKNIVSLMNLLKSYLPQKTLVVWTTTPPISGEPYGGFLIKQIEFMKHTIRFDVMEANMFVRQEVASHGFDVLDVHFHLLLQIHRRRPDGIHWNGDAVRHITNLILTHVSLSWGKPLPGNFDSPILKNMENFVPAPVVKEPEEQLRQLDRLLNVWTSPVGPAPRKKPFKRRRGNDEDGGGLGPWRKERNTHQEFHFHFNGEDLPNYSGSQEQYDNYHYNARSHYNKRANHGRYRNHQKRYRPY